MTSGTTDPTGRSTRAARTKTRDDGIGHAVARAATEHAAPLRDMLAHFMLLEPVFDAMPDIVFFVKDRDARYAMVNRTLACRCGYKDDKTRLLGKTAEQVLPSRFGRIYTAQDQAVVAQKHQHRSARTASVSLPAASPAGA